MPGMRRPRWPLYAFVLAGSIVLAQEGTDDAGREVEEIVVTGSRIARDEFSSPSPLQVFDIDESKQIGISSVAEMLLRSTIVNGEQIDETLNTAPNSNMTEEPPPGGVGSTNVSLRGLSAERTLVLVNGRRLGSVGVRGAPAQPDVSMIPFTMVERVEVLTEGVSAVYGADAVAGVVNVILRRDFDGLEVSLNTEQPEAQGGESRQASVTMGATGDRISMTLGIEYASRERVATGWRDASHCRRAVLQPESGPRIEYCTDGHFDNMILTQETLDPVTQEPAGFLFYTPDGSTDIGVPHFATWRVAVPDPSVIDERLRNRERAGNFVYYDFYNEQDELRASDIVAEQSRVSVVGTGTVDLGWWANEEAFFEAWYLDSRVFSRAATEQIFPFIPGFIPQEDANGNILVDASGAPVLAPNPLNPFGEDAEPIVTLESLPQTRDVERAQFRFVGGLRGDVGDSSWSYEGFYSYDRGTGFQAQPILFEPRLVQATRGVRFDRDGNLTCDELFPGSPLGGFDTPDRCVPLNMFADDVYTGGVTGEGVLSQAEIDYLIGNRTNRTIVEQTVLGAYATGRVFDVSAREARAAFGAEYRVDEIDSQHDITGIMGLNAAENPLQEGRTVGERSIYEIYGEIFVPVLDALDLEAALRYTDEENFGAETTWRARFSYRPLESFRISGSAGTSYRAPNLREQFLAGQGGGVSGGIDPCRAGNFAGQIEDGVDPADPDFQNLVENCAAAGIPFEDTDGDGLLDSGGISGPIATIPTAAGGNENATPETSTSWSTTVQFTQPWTRRVDFDLALSYWDIEIKDTLEEVDAGSVLGQCYENIEYPNLTSPFCPRIERAAGGHVTFVDISFMNIGRRTAKGIDLNTRLRVPLERWGADLLWQTVTSRQLEQETEFLGPEDRDDNVGEIAYPEIKFNSTLSLLRNSCQVMMHNRYIGRARADDPTGFVTSNLLTGAPLVMPVQYVDSSWYTDLSLTLSGERWNASLGVNNLLDRQPPIIQNGGPNRNNAVVSSGYDLIGRSYFARLTMDF